MRKTTTQLRLTATGCCILLAGCWDDSSDSTGPDFPLEAGAYEVTLSDDNGNTESAEMLLSGGGSYVVANGLDDYVLGRFEPQANGRITSEALSVSYEPARRIWTSETGTLAGRASGTSEATLESSSDTDDETFTLEVSRLEDLSDTALSLDKLNGTYTMAEQTDVNGTGLTLETTTITIDGNGMMTGQEATGDQCNVDEAEVTIPDDPRSSVFEVSFVLVGCATNGRNGDYTGMGIYAESGDIEIIASNGDVNYAFSSPLD